MLFFTLFRRIFAVNYLAWPEIDQFCSVVIRSGCDRITTWIPTNTINGAYRVIKRESEIFYQNEFCRRSSPPSLRVDQKFWYSDLRRLRLINFHCFGKHRSNMYKLRGKKTTVNQIGLACSKYPILQVGVALSSVKLSSQRQACSDVSNHAWGIVMAHQYCCSICSDQAYLAIIYDRLRKSQRSITMRLADFQVEIVFMAIYIR